MFTTDEVSHILLFFFSICTPKRAHDLFVFLNCYCSFYYYFLLFPTVAIIMLIISPLWNVYSSYSHLTRKSLYISLCYMLSFWQEKLKHDMLTHIEKNIFLCSSITQNFWGIKRRKLLTNCWCDPTLHWVHFKATLRLLFYVDYNSHEAQYI